MSIVEITTCVQALPQEGKSKLFPKIWHPRNYCFYLTLSYGTSKLFPKKETSCKKLPSDVINVLKSEYLGSFTIQGGK